MIRALKQSALPLVVVILLVALGTDFRSVEKIDLDAAGHSSAARTSAPRQEPIHRTAPPKRTNRPDRHLHVGDRYTSLAALIEDQRTDGFLRLGTFGNHWPATVTEIATDRDGISFLKRGGIRHSYERFTGYDLKMVRLKAGRKETIVVFRSADKR